MYKKYKIMLEISNWKKMHSINEHIWNDRIYGKFIRYDKHDRCFHIVVMNHRNCKLLQRYTQNTGTLIMELKEHYTPELLEILEKRGEFIDDNLL